MYSHMNSCMDLASRIFIQVMEPIRSGTGISWAAQGHGFAAEQANNLHDILTGKDAKIVGGDNAKDGPDRMVNGVNIQTKYCHDAASSVQAAFENG